MHGEQILPVYRSQNIGKEYGHKNEEKNLKLLWMVMVVGALLGGCGGKESQPAADSAEKTTTSVQETASEAQETVQAAALEDGVYTADFDTDSGMFHVSEACDGKAP